MGFTELRKKWEFPVFRNLKIEIWLRKTVVLRWESNILTGHSSGEAKGETSPAHSNFQEKSPARSNF